MVTFRKYVPFLYWKFFFLKNVYVIFLSLAMVSNFGFIMMGNWSKVGWSENFNLCGRKYLHEINYHRSFITYVSLHKFKTLFTQVFFQAAPITLTTTNHFGKYYD